MSINSIRRYSIRSNNSLLAPTYLPPPSFLCHPLLLVQILLSTKFAEASTVGATRIVSTICDCDSIDIENSAMYYYQIYTIY